MTNFFTYMVLVIGAIFMTTFSANSQINTPRASQMATVSQTIGTSTVSIEYSRPSVQGREIYGTPIVHYGYQNLGFGTSTAAPWRAGANENTKITFSHNMKVNGREIKAGTYGLHIAVKEDNTATIIFSKNSTSWGSFTYDEAEDALRVDVNTVTVPETELLTFNFDEVSADKARVMLSWEKKGFPFTVEVPVTEIVMADIRNSLRGQPGFNIQTWQQAANFALNNGGDLDEALGWIDAAIAGNFFSKKTFANLMIKSAILAKMEKQNEALTLMDENLDLGSIFEVHQYGRQLITMGLKDKAMEIFEYNANKNKDTWPVHYGLARGYSAKGDYKKALKHLEKAHTNAPNAASKGRVAANIEKLKNKEDIN